MAALAKQWSSGALDRAEKLRTSIITNGRSLARAASTRSARAPESHLIAPEGEGCLPSRYDAVFPFQRLGIKLAPGRVVYTSLARVLSPTSKRGADPSAVLS